VTGGAAAAHKTGWVSIDFTVLPAPGQAFGRQGPAAPGLAV